MLRRSLRFRSPVLFVGALLAFSLFTGCKQGIGDRCEVASDCDTNFCSLSSDSQNGICCDPNNTQTCIIQGGMGGAAGSSGQGGSGGAAADASPDGVSSPDASDDGASTD